MNEFFVVKFDKGYYAKKQPEYNWSYTDNLSLANRYKSFTAAKVRAELGIALFKQWKDSGHYLGVHPQSYCIERYESQEIINLIESVYG